jgi:Ca2+-binding EF-hand superfamily protein
MKFNILIISQLLVARSFAFLAAPASRTQSALYSSYASSSTQRRSDTFSDSELETAFFSIDVDSKGSIPRSAFGEAIADLGVDLSQVQLDLLFSKYDADKGGSIDLDEFKAMMSDPVLAGVTPQRDVKFAMDLFKRYDADNSGTIDKGEFRNIAREIQLDARRRSLFSVAAAAVGATVVADYSQEYQFSQKKFRSLYIEPKAEEAQKIAFPTAMLSSDMDEAIARTLYKRGL